jgi:hypothetical protein
VCGSGTLLRLTAVPVRLFRGRLAGLQNGLKSTAVGALPNGAKSDAVPVHLFRGRLAGLQNGLKSAAVGALPNGAKSDSFTSEVAAGAVCGFYLRGGVKKKRSSAQLHSELHSMKQFCQIFYEITSALNKKLLHQRSQSYF